MSTPSNCTLLCIYVRPNDLCITLEYPDVATTKIRNQTILALSSAIQYLLNQWFAQGFGSGFWLKLNGFRALDHYRREIFKIYYCMNFFDNFMNLFFSFHIFEVPDPGPYGLHRTTDTRNMKIKKKPFKIIFNILDPS